MRKFSFILMYWGQMAHRLCKSCFGKLLGVHCLLLSGSIEETDSIYSCNRLRDLMTRCEDLYAKSILTIFGFVCARYVFVVVPFQKKVNGRINLVQNHYLEFYTLKIRSLLNMEQDSIKSSSISSRFFYSKLQDSGIEQVAAPCKFFRIFQYPLKRACSLNAVFNSGPH